MSDTISVSLASGSSVIIGQNLTLTVTLTSDTQISSNTNVYVQNRKNINVLDYSDIKIIGDGTTASLTIDLEVSRNLNSNDTIRFNILRTDTSESMGIQYTAKTLDLNSIKLYLDTDYLHLPKHENDSPTGNFCRVMATIKDEQNSILPNVPVFISSDNPDYLELVDLYFFDQQTKINVEKSGNNKGFTLISNNNGRLIFYIYPKLPNPVVLNLYSIIDGVTGETPADKILSILSKDPADSRELLPAPKIDGFNGGDLNTGGSTTFYVEVPSYEDAQIGDVIHFLVDRADHHYVHTLQDLSKLGNYFIFLPFSMLPKGVACKFSYLVVHPDNTKNYSEPLELTFTGESWPPATFYDACVVYSSLGTDNPNNIVEQADPVDCADIEQDSIINCNTIKKYKDNKNDSGLFIQITGTNDISDKTKPPLGGHITLTLSITSNPRVVHHSFSGYIPSQPGADGTTAVTTIGIDHKWLTGCGKYENCQTGLITFTYSVTSDNQTAYSSTWKGRIDTIPSGAIDCGD
ncbi:hypothetical protein [Xenorhabdus bovienii]|uniref:hypothetical protein n=1 Tax=Xenorhabdus bovienii TaxID=40576 RepID=UPI00237C8647|nr:hypothetical protein [Xenorhabdus bovienii]MDE1483608.1 hypothetical protein [Xenorhabdus bovienii]MDE9442846.1 hypothetical protein [Xenorhabdus bovienii]MDE9459221.1 hypothetical protein [Xenorhabdus bovienii]MDE9462926.1 hypothetical protein [Xenorhabdus bovienii]MDE9470794.1 hypothetical protein [Xenorhabdus bovienii]